MDLGDILIFRLFFKGINGMEKLLNFSCKNVIFIPTNKSFDKEFYAPKKVVF